MTVPTTKASRSRRRLLSAVALALTAASISGATASAGRTVESAFPSGTVAVSAPAISTLEGARFADTRVGGATIDGQFVGAGQRVPGSTYEVDIAGRGDVPEGAVGAIVNITSVDPAAPGFFTLYGCGVRPTASALNYTTGVNVANEVLAELSASGTACVYTSAASHVLLDVVGFVLEDYSVKLLDPARVAESRLGATTIDGKYQGFGRTSPGGTETIRIAGRAGVPMGVPAAILNVAAVDPDSDSFITVHPCLPTAPLGSSLNHTSDVNRANELVARLDSSGDICVYTDQDVDLIIDVVGYVEPMSDLMSTNTQRFADTRPGAATFDGQYAGVGLRAADSTTEVVVAGRGDVPANASAAVINVAAVDPTSAGFFTVDGCNTPRPNASSLNYTADVNGANEIVVQLSADGKICVYTQSATHVILDVVGFLKPELTDLQLLGFNDYHGHLQRDTPGKVAEIAGGTEVDAGGAEFLSAKLNELREGEPYSLTVAAGDLIGGSPAFSGLFHDEPSVESLNTMELDVSSVGNHEFDEGVTELLRMQDGGCHPVDGCYFPGTPYPGADFQWLSANVVKTADDTTPLPPYWVETVKNVKVGFIGMTLEGTDELVAAAGIAGYEFRDEADTANALVPILQAQGVETIIVLLHEGASQTPPPGDVNACVDLVGPVVAINDALDPAIDAMITGHTHLPYNCRLPDSAGHDRIVTSAYSFGRVVSEVNLVLDRRSGDVVRDDSSAFNHIVQQSALTPDPEQTAIIDRWQPLFDDSGNDPVGTITADINRGGTPPGTDRGVESPAGNLVADAQRWATSSNGADVAFMNPGGVRSDLTFAESQTPPEGDGVVTFGEAFTFQPFGNRLVTYEMTGAEIIAVLKEQCQPAGSSRPILHLGVSDGLTYDLDTTVVAGDCTSVVVSNVVLNGSALSPAGTYAVTVNSFLADGGDNFDTFGTITTPRLDGGIDLDALTNYLGTFSPVAPPSTDRVNEI